MQTARRYIRTGPIGRGSRSRPAAGLGLDRVAFANGERQRETFGRADADADYCPEQRNDGVCGKARAVSGRVESAAIPTAVKI